MKTQTIALAVLIPPAVLVALVALCLAVGSVLALVGGWHKIEGTYPARLEGGAEDMDLSSVTLRRGLLVVNYNSSVRLSIGPDGLGITASSLFRRFHPPIFIPWKAVRQCKREKLLAQEVTTLSPGDSGVEVIIRGESGKRVFDFWKGRQGD